jgi:hypothetical protein
MSHTSAEKKRARRTADQVGDRQAASAFFGVCQGCHTIVCQCS